MLRGLLWASALILLLAIPASAKDLCVNGSTGNDSTTYASNNGSAQDGTGTCWATIGRAAWGSTNRGSPNSGQAAQAGDTVWIAAGTYTTTGTGNRWEVAYHPANNGTSSNYIRFVGVGTVILTYSSGTGPVIGLNNREYIEWKNITINEANANYASDSGPVVCAFSTGAIFDRLTLTGRSSGPTNGDNYNGIRFEDCYDSIIRNSSISGFSAGDANNHTGITTYYSGNILIENNEIYGNLTGIYLKANFGSDPLDIIIRKNIIRNNGRGINVHRNPTDAAQPTLIAQNIIRDNSALGVFWRPFDGGSSDPRHVYVVNNTLVDNAIGIGSYVDPTSDANWRAENNIIVGGNPALGWVMEDSGTFGANQGRMNRNVYYNASTVVNAYGTNRTLAQWRTLSGQDADSIESNPLFVNVAADDYHLDSGSPALTLGRALYGVGGADNTTIPAGAYITGDEIIGICPTDACESSEATVPDAPTIGTATAGNGQCSVSFTPPGNDGGATITGYTATSSPGSFTASGSASPLVVTGLTNGVGYTFTVVATNSEGNSASSGVSNTCTPTAPPPGAPVRLRFRGGF